MDDLIEFQPMLVGRFSESGPLQIEAGVLTKYDDLVWLGLGFRSGGIYATSVGANVSDKINVLHG